MNQEKMKEIEDLIDPILHKENLSLDHFEFVKEGGDSFLRVYIDKPGGVDLMDCSYVSERISEKLDENDPIHQPYYLEVSSPGAEKPLKTTTDFENHVGENIYVSLYIHIDDEKEYEGILKEFENDTVTIEYKWKHTKKEVQIPFDKIAKARLAVML